MPGLLVTRRVQEQLGEQMRALAEAAGKPLETVLLPDDPAGRLDAEALAPVEAAFFSGDLFPDRTRGFFAAAQGAPNLRWLQTFNAGIDNPVFSRIMAKGVRITTSSGATAVPIAQTAITGLLMLARGFPVWLESQQRKAWEPRRSTPPDLQAQTLVVVGLGAIGTEIARLAQAIGMHVIGVRRSPAKGGEPVDEMVTPAELDRVLPRADWLALATPLTPETEGLIDARRLALLPDGAGFLNVGRGALVDEGALIGALAARRLGGAYLDVVSEEPLPPDSPLWTLPNVFITPHNSSISAGNEARIWEIFLENLEAWLNEAPMRNEVVD